MEERHAEERRVLRERTQELLRAAKKDKALKKKARKEVAAMEEELRVKQAQEVMEEDMAQFRIQAHGSKGVSKGEQRRAKRDKQRKEERKAAEKEAEAMVDEKQIEIDALRRQLEPMGLDVFEVQADGHCLFRSIAAQLRLNDASSTDTHETLRQSCGEAMLRCPSDYIGLTMDEKGELILSEEDLVAYVSRLQRLDGPIWGGESEIAALSRHLGRRIRVFAAECEPIVYSFSDAVTEPLQISFHKHIFGLGNHYNSVVSK